MNYYEYTGRATIAHFTYVEIAVAVPEGSTNEEARLLMEAAAKNAALYGGDESQTITFSEFSRGRRLAPVEGS